MECKKYRVDLCKYAFISLCKTVTPTCEGDLASCEFPEYARGVIGQLREQIEIMERPDQLKGNTDLRRINLSLAKSELETLEQAFPHL